MLEKIPLFLIVHDEPTLELGKDILWIEVASVVNEKAGIVWDMKGQIRLIPYNLLADYWQLEQAHQRLAALGRNAEIDRRPLVFTREQTIDIGFKDVEPASR
jgi:hypothetical protein